MPQESLALLVVGPGAALRWAMEELKRRHGYRVCYAADPYEAGILLGTTSVNAIICEAAPAYSSGCRLVREICQRTAHLPVFLFVEPEAEDYVFDEVAQGAFYVVRSTTSVENFHRLLEDVIARHRRIKAA